MRNVLRSVRFQLPALLVVVGAAVYTLSLFMALQRTTATGLESREMAARTSLNAQARMLAMLHYHGADEATEEIVAQLGTISDVECAAFVDADGRVVAATRGDWRDAPLDSVLGRDAAQLASRARGEGRTSSVREPDGRTLIAVPVRAGTLDAQGRVTRGGLLVVRLDFRPLIATLRRETIRFYLIMALMTAVAVIAVWLFLHVRVARPALRIMEAAQRLAQGDREVRTALRGDDELSRTGQAFDDMAERVRENESYIRRQQELFDGLLRALPVGVFVVDRATRTVLYANRTLFDLGGYESPVGTPLDQLEGRRENSAGEPFALAELPIERALTEGRPVRNDDLVYVRPDGTRVPVVTTAHPMNLGGGPDFDAVVAVIQDRRIIERAFAELRESEERFQQASLATGQAVYEWDFVRDRCRFSDSLKSIFGYAHEELDSNAKWDAITHPDDLAAVHAEMQASRNEHRPFEATYRIRHRDGRWRWVRDRGLMRFGADGQPALMIGAVGDVTDQRDLEARLRQSQKMETVGTLAGGVAHDFNNQLTGVLGHLDLLAEDLAPGDPHLDYVLTARKAAERCAELTRGLLAFSRMLRSEARAVDVNALLEESATLLRRVLPATIHLDLVVDPSTPEALVDPTQLQQVVLNLCVNARDAMPQGGTLRLDARASRVEGHVGDGGASGPGDYVTITVADEGTGIAPDVLPRIFEPFFTTKPVGEGTGLGLAMVYGIVTQHRGWIDVDSTPGKGATFRVHLPAARAASPPAASSRPARAATARYAPRTVLVVDDEAIVRRLACQLLERAGCRVLEAADGDAALKLLHEHAAEVESLLLDLTMPGRPLREVLREIRTLAPHVRLVLTSGYSQESSLLDEFAGLPFLAKPWVPSRMLDMLCAPADVTTS